MPIRVTDRADGVQDAVRNAIRTARIELGGDYEGWVATMRVNPSQLVWEDFSSGDDERFDSALKSLVIGWNFVDDEGKPLPLPSDGLDWKTAPFDLKLRLTNAYTVVVQARMSAPKEVSTLSEPMSQNGI